MHRFDGRARNSVRIQPIGNEGLELLLALVASGATSWRADAPLVEVFDYCGKFFIIN
jgi:hypothetical protein